MKTFQELSLIAPLQQSLAEEAYETPTPIQQQTVPAALQGRDILGCAQTGTGKTAAFALPILNHLGSKNRKARPKRPFALILAPTRELAIQIGESFATYGRHLKLRQALVYGGVNQTRQVKALERGAHILIATPGRLLDLMDQGYIELHQLEVFVLDEADRMLDMGFMPDLRRIIKCLPRKRQSLFFSATLPPKIVDLTKRLLHDPVNVHIEPETRSVEAITQSVMFVDRGAKQTLLKNMLRGDDVDRAIVFTRTKRGANRVAEKLVRSGIRATAIHGNKSQNARQRALTEFRNSEVTVLVATDVAARGIDVDGVSHVFNFEIPNDPESYVHRIGRTGRAGASGIAYSFCAHDEKRDLLEIERLIGQQVPRSAQPVFEGSPPRSHDEDRIQAPIGGGGDSQNRTTTNRKPARARRRSGAGSSSGQSNRSPIGGASRPGKRRPATKKVVVRTGKVGSVRGEANSTGDSSSKQSQSDSKVNVRDGAKPSAQAKPKRRRRPRKGRNERLRAKQQSST